MLTTSTDQLEDEKIYTYSDYLLWKLNERVELFKGKISKMSPAPARIHQDRYIQVFILKEGMFIGYSQ